MTELRMILKLRRDNEFVSTYKLEAGEPGYEISTNTLKIGDGEHTWAELPLANKGQIQTLINQGDADTLAAAKQYADGKFKVKQTAYSASGTTKQTITGVSQNENGDVTVTYGDIDFAHNHDSEYKKLQTAIESVQTAKNTFIDTVAQDAQGVVTITTKSVDFGDYYTKDQCDGKFETIENANLIRQDITNITTAETGLIDTAKKAAIAAAKTETETQISTFKTGTFDPLATTVSNMDTAYKAADEALSGKIAAVEGKLNNVSNVMDFVGAGASLPAIADSNKGDVFVINIGDDAGKEYVFDGVEWVEFGFATANESAIAELREDVNDHEERITALENLPCTDITDDQIKAWDTVVTEAVRTGEFTQFKADNSQAIADAEARAKQEAKDKADAALAAAKEYVAEFDHEDTTYTFAPTTNALEFTATPAGKGEAQVVKLVAPTVDTGVMEVKAGTSNSVITATTEAGVVTVSHKDYSTGTVKAATGTEEPNFVTSINIENGHVTGATVNTLSAALLAMGGFILDGGTSKTQEPPIAQQ